MHTRVTRRDLLKKSALAGAAFWLGAEGYAAKPPSSRLDVAFVGVGGRGRANLLTIAQAKENVVAIAEVDEERGGESLRMFPKARKFHDYRTMFDAMHAGIDAVLVATPDHSHAGPTVTAMRLGKHCYCEKPLTHCVHEAAVVARVAAEAKVATQLGTQHHAEANTHSVVELIRAGAVGPVRECHVWIGGERGGGERPKDTPPVPAHLKWDLWLGPRPARPYNPAYAPYKWRFWWDFGTGETGNNGVHIMDFAYWALDLPHPTEVWAEGPPVSPETSPKHMHVHYSFPARGKLPPVALDFYHAKDGPSILARHGLPHHESGVLFVGEKGMLLATYGKFKLFPEKKFADYRMPLPTIPQSMGHHKEWIHASKTGSPTTCNFAYGSRLTQIVLLGNVAYRTGKKLRWDPEHVRAVGCPEADVFLREPRRPGWAL